LRLGHRVIANELNPVASVILKATLDYPARYGLALLNDIARWGDTLRETVEAKMAPFTPFSPIPADQRVALERHLRRRPDLVDEYATEHDHMGLLYCRQVTCPHCGGDAPLLNSFWLAKRGEQWGVAMQPQADKTVRFEPYVLGSEGRKPDARTLDAGTVARGVGQCVHCHQAIAGDEIKRQARGESELGCWQGVLYCVVGIRLEPKLDKHGEVQRFASGARKGEIKTSKVRYFRAPNATDRQALAAASAELEARRFDFEMKGLVPNEPFPHGNDMRPVNYGMPTWTDMFTPRQLLGHLTVMEALRDAKPRILAELGEEKGRAVATYLHEFAFDDALQMSRSLNVHLQQRSGNYRVSDDSVAYAGAGDGERAAPLAIRGSKLRLLKPEERAEQRLEHPQTLWDVLCGLIGIYREGGIVAARNYLGTHDKRDSAALRGLLKVWANKCDDEALRREALLIDYEL